MPHRPTVRPIRRRPKPGPSVSSGVTPSALEALRRIIAARVGPEWFAVFLRRPGARSGPTLRSALRR